METANEIETAKKRAVIRGTITYHDDPSTLAPKGIKLHGSVDPLFIDLADEPGVTDCADAADLGLSPFDPNRTATFQGDYWSQDTTLPATTERGRFRVGVFDTGEPGSPASSLPDYFDIRLLRSLHRHNRAGYIEGGNIQVDNT